MKDFIEGVVGALIVSLIPLAICYLAWKLDKREERKRADPELTVVLNHLENAILDRLNRRS